MKQSILLSSILSSAILFQLFNKTIAIPKSWGPSLTLIYTTQSKQYASYIFNSDTLYLKKGFAGKDLKHKLKLTKEQLDGLLMTLRNNDADKIKTENIKYQKHDGTSFVLALKIGNNYVFNLTSNGTKYGKEIRKKDAMRYNAIVEKILKIAKSVPQ